MKLDEVSAYAIPGIPRGEGPLSKEHPYLAKKLGEVMGSSNVESILEVVVDTCPHCWESPKPCSCWNDD